MQFIELVSYLDLPFSAAMDVIYHQHVERKVWKLLHGFHDLALEEFALNQSGVRCHVTYGLVDHRNACRICVTVRGCIKLASCAVQHAHTDTAKLNSNQVTMH